MEKKSDIDYYVKNAYRALAEFLAHVQPKSALASKIAIYDYLHDRYCYVWIGENDNAFALRIYLEAEDFVNYLETACETDDFYSESALIGQNYTAVYLMCEEALSEKALEIYRHYAFKWQERWPIICQRKAGEAEKILWDKDILRTVCAVLERLSALFREKSWASNYLAQDKTAHGDEILLIDYQNGVWQKKTMSIKKLYAELAPKEFPNPFLLNRLAQKKSDGEMYEMSWFYIPVEQQTADSRYYPLYANLVNLADGRVVFSALSQPPESREQLIEQLAKKLAQMEKRPEVIVTADYILWRYLDDFCQKSGIILRYIEEGIVKARITEGFRIMLEEAGKAARPRHNTDKIITLQAYREKNQKE